MSLIKKIIATLTGAEQAPDRSAATEKFREEREREENLAREREQMHQQSLRERQQREVSEGVEEEIIPLDELNK